MFQYRLLIEFGRPDLHKRIFKLTATGDASERLDAVLHRELFRATL